MQALGKMITESKKKFTETDSESASSVVSTAARSSSHHPWRYDVGRPSRPR